MTCLAFGFKAMYYGKSRKCKCIHDFGYQTFLTLILVSKPWVWRDLRNVKSQLSNDSHIWIIYLVDQRIMIPSSSILQILWRMSEKSMEVISSIRELKFCFFWKKWSVFSRFFTFLNFKNKILKKQRNFIVRKHHDFRRFSENDLLNKIARIFLIFQICGSFRV